MNMFTRPPTSPSAPAAVPTPQVRTAPVLLAMCLSLVLVVASVSALNLALPNMAVALGASNATLTWIADAYTVALAALVLPLGALGDRIGRRNVLIAGTVVFGVAAFFAAQSDTANALILWRVVMGAGAAMIMPGTLSTITAVFPAEKRARGVATWSGFASAGAVIGLLGAGALLERWGWQSVFMGSAVLAVIAGLAALLLTPNTRDDETHPADIFGTLGIMVGIGTLIFGIIEGNEQGWTQPAVLIALMASLFGFTGYVIASTRHPHPILDPRLFKHRGFRTGTATIVVQFMAVFGFFFVGLQYLQLILGYGPLKSALALIPVVIVVLPISQSTPYLAKKFGNNIVMALGLLVLAGGMGVIAQLETTSGYVPFLVGLSIVGIGMGLTSSTSTNAIVGSLPPEQQGVASAVNDATREIGSALGVALMGSVYGAQYRDALPEIPAELPHAAAQAIEHSAAGGLAVAQRMSAMGEPAASFAQQVSTAVEHAFMSGLSASVLVIAGVLVVAAVVVGLRGPRHSDATEEIILPSVEADADDVLITR